MTMDALERLSQLGQVERVDQAVLDSALQELAGAIRADATCVPARRQTNRRRSTRINAVVTAALASAAVVAGVAWLGHSVPPRRATSAPSPRATSPDSSTMTAVLTAFTASRDDILMVTKIVRGEGTCCKTIMWISPAGSAPGGAVRARIQNLSLGGSRLSDMMLSYTAPATGAAVAGLGCDGIFSRPKLALTPATGIPGNLTLVSYLSRIWVKGKVRVQSATVPSAAPIRACLKDGQWSDVGHRMLAGSKAIELISPGGFERLWVSAATFLPIRLMSISPTRITFAFKFLRPTAANEAALAPPPIPAGFSRKTLPG
jgi:hypothetical protein